MKLARRPLKPRTVAPVPSYPALATGVAILLGMGTATSCGGADGGVIRRSPDGTRFFHEESDSGSDAGAGGASANDVGPSDAGNPVDAADAGDAGSPTTDGGTAEDPAADGGDAADANSAAP